MKISGRIKALIVMAVVVYVLAHVVRAMLMTLMRSNALLNPSRPSPRVARQMPHRECNDAETLKQCTRC